MRPQGMKPRFGIQGQPRPNSCNQNNIRPQFTRPPPPFHKGRRQLRGNDTPIRNGRPPGPYGAMVGFNGQMMMPNGPIVGPNRPMAPMMMPCGPMMGPNGPMTGPNGPMMGPNGPVVPPGFMDPSSFHMMTPPPPIGTPMPVGSMISANGGFPKNANGKGPYQPAVKMEKEGVQQGKGDRTGKHGETGQNNTSNDSENSYYNFPQFGAAQGMSCGWQGNGFPDTWNFSSPTNQLYPQNSDPQYNNQGYNHTFYQNYDQGYNQNFDGSYNQYYNHRQPFMQGYNVKQEHTDNFNQKNNQNGAFSVGSKNVQKNKKRKELSQKMRTHYCDTCDKSFPTDEALATHISEHKVCGLDECKFTAHPKVVDKHQQMQHFTGLYRRIGSLYTPEDIEKWRKDRKKNYPTPQNVEERRAKQNEMFARGERMGAPNNRFPRNNQQRNGRFPQREHPRANQQNPSSPPSSRPPPRSVPTEPPKKWKPIFPPVKFEIEESEERSGVKPFPGTAALLPKDSISSEKNAPLIPEESTTLAEKAALLPKDDTTSSVEKATLLRKENTSSAENGASTQTVKTNPSNGLSFLSIYGNSSSEEDSDTEESQESSTNRHVEENSKGNCPSEPMTVENTSIPETTESSPVNSKTETESSNELHGVTSSEPTPLEADTVRTNVGEDCDSSLADPTNEPVLEEPQYETETNTTKDGECFQDATATNEESDMTDPSSSLAVSQESTTSPSNERQRTELPAPVTDPKISTSEKSINNEAYHQTESIQNVSDNPKSVSDDHTHVPDKPSCDTASQEPSEEVSISNDLHDSSDDSGPEEVPISRDSSLIGDNDDTEEGVDASVNSGGGRKRKRQSRQPPKKMKTDNEKSTTEDRPQDQPPNKNQKRSENDNRAQRIHRAPFRRAPTLLEKLLSKEICHERNVILQCVRYVVENNYFRGDRLEASEGGTS